MSSLDVFGTLIELHVDGVSFSDVLKVLIESCVDFVELDYLMIDKEEVPNDPDDLDGGHLDKSRWLIRRQL